VAHQINKGVKKLDKAESILKQSGFIGTAEAADVIGIQRGGHVSRWLDTQDVESVSVPTNGKAGRERRLWLKADVKAVAHLYRHRGKNKRTEGDVIARIERLEKRLDDICEHIGMPCD